MAKINFSKYAISQQKDSLPKDNFQVNNQTIKIITGKNIVKSNNEAGVAPQIKFEESVQRCFSIFIIAILNRN